MIPIDSAGKRRLRSAALRWYARHGRRLPWRTSADPYRVWLSEIMLQQTTVAAVVPYFERFIARFPDVRSLASAEVDDVLRLWEGLGYYSRARNLHKAAVEVVQDHDGKFPAHVESLRSLPGIGRYTAGAIASFAYGLPAPIVEANTERLYARLIAVREDVRSAASQRALWDFATQIVPRVRAGDFNQALMDIGAQICRPQQPNCEVCPLKPCCEAFALGIQNELPRRKERVQITEVNEICFVIYTEEKFLLRRRTEQERWAGMWDFVRFEIEAAEIDSLPFSSFRKQKNAAKSSDLVRTQPLPGRFSETLSSRVQSLTGVKPENVIAGTEFTYSVTRYRVRLLGYLCSVSALCSTAIEGTQWFTMSEIHELPLSRTGRRIVEWLNSR